ncbi:hypothetical protein HLH33_09805 [Gluconacetobacter diazotrophicus]|uniref:Uncharacterized protein n=1 Tax=Gluconacetobacter diazotrophicus TaxID=33996 RepID=A0A7W4FF52_GLUDI|nr:hypothetical protein [Gluconacetobacter diazotrophicus]
MTDAQAEKLIAAANGRGPRASAAKAKAPKVRRFGEARPVVQITIEAAARLAPPAEKVARIVAYFGVEDPDAPAIRESTEAAIVASARELAPVMNERALSIHLQRVVGSFVGSAVSSAQFYDTKAAEARNLSSAIANEHRDEDRMGIDGGENEAARARAFAAQLGVQAFALLAAAEGAVSAYAHLTGEEWKPYARAVTPQRSVARRAAAEELSCFDRD